MILEKAIKMAKGEEIEKVQIALKVVPELKELVNKTAKENGVTTNALITSLLELALNGKYDSDLERVTKIENLELEEQHLIDLKESGHDILELNNGSVLVIDEKLKSVQGKLSILRGNA